MPCGRYDPSRQHEDHDQPTGAYQPANELPDSAPIVHETEEVKVQENMMEDIIVEDVPLNMDEGEELLVEDDAPIAMFDSPEEAV